MADPAQPVDGDRSIDRWIDRCQPVRSGGVADPAQPVDGDRSIDR